MKGLKVFRNRRGELVPLIIIACLGLIELGTRQIFHDPDYYQRERWPIPLGLFLSAAVIRTLTQRKPSALAVQKQEWLISSSNDDVPAHMSPKRSVEWWRIFRERDHFFIPVRFWPWVLCGLGILSYFLPRSALG